MSDLAIAAYGAWRFHPFTRPRGYPEAVCSFEDFPDQVIPSRLAPAHRSSLSSPVPDRAVAHTLCVVLAGRGSRTITTISTGPSRSTTVPLAQGTTRNPVGRPGTS